MKASDANRLFVLTDMSDVWQLLRNEGKSRIPLLVTLKIVLKSSSLRIFSLKCLNGGNLCSFYANFLFNINIINVGLWKLQASRNYMYLNKLCKNCLSMTYLFLITVK